MNPDNKKMQSRKQFIGWGLSATAVLTAIRFWPHAKKKTKPSGKTVTMLTQDGRLVEVDVSAIPSQKKKITNRELQSWMTKK